MKKYGLNELRKIIPREALSRVSITNTKDLKNFYKDNKTIPPKKCENVNYKFLHNKDGKFDWRPFEIIHPALYVYLVNEICEKENWKKTLDINLIAPFVLTKLVGKEMMKQKSGAIINISSTNGINTYYPTSVDYDASKSGLISLTYDSAVQFAPYVRVNCVAPGWVNTEMNKELPEDFVKEETERILVKRFAEPKEIAKVVTFLASEDASIVNSTVIKVDGGWY